MNTNVILLEMISRVFVVMDTSLKRMASTVEVVLLTFNNEKEVK